MNTGSLDVSVIDVARATAVATISLGARPEGAAVDGSGRVYVNLEDKAQIAVIDSSTRRVVATHGLPGCIEPTGLAFDPIARLLIAACHNRVAKLIDAASGEDRGTVGIGKDADGAIFDAGRRLVYVPSADGVLTIFRLSAGGQPTMIASLATAPGARTAALDERSGRIYLAANSGATATREAFQLVVVAP